MANVNSDIGNQLDRTFFWILYASYGVPFTIVLVAAIWLLHRSKWQLNFLPGTAWWVARKLNLIKPGDDAVQLRNIRIVWWMTVGFGVILFVPFLLLLIWGSVAASWLTPQLIGVAIFTMWSAGLLLMYVVVLWHQRRWRVLDYTLNFITVWHLFLVLAAALVFTFLIVAVFEYESFTGTSWVFLCFNVMPLVFISYWYSSTGVLVADHKAVLSGDMSTVPSESAEYQRVVQEYKYKRFVRAMIFYGMSLLILIFYGIVATITSPSGEKGLGWAQLAAVIGLDIITALMHAAELVPSPVFVSLLITFSRAAFVSAGPYYWFIGHSAVFLVFGVGLGILLVRKYIPEQQLIPLEVLRMSKVNIGESSDGRPTSASPAPVVAPPTVIDRLKTPEAVFAVLHLLFIIELIIVALIRPGGAPLPSVQFPESTQQQWTFGLGSLFVVWIIDSLMFTIELIRQKYILNRTRGLAEIVFKQHNRKLLISTIVTEVFIVVAGVVLYAAGGSITILAGAVFVPPALVSFLAFYERWTHQDFQVFSPRVQRVVRSLVPDWHPPTSLNPADAVSQAPSDSAQQTPAVPPAADQVAPAGATDPGTGVGVAAGGAASSASAPPSTSPRLEDVEDSPRPGTVSPPVPPANRPPAQSTRSVVHRSVRDQLKDVGPQNWWDSGVPLYLAGLEPLENIRRFPRAWVSGDFRRVWLPSAFIRGGCTANDYFMFVCMVFIAGSLIGFGLTVSTGWTTATWVGGAIAGGFAILMCTALSILGYFGTMTFTPFVIGTGVVASLLHIGGHVWLWSAISNFVNDYKALGVLLSFFMYPTLVCLACAFVKWRDDKYNISRPVLHLCITAQVLLIGFVIGVFFVDVIAGFAVTAAYVLFASVLAIIVVWVRNNFWLPLGARIFAGCVVAAVVIPGIGVGIFASDDTAFRGFTVSWFCLVLVLAVAAISSFLRSHVIFGMLVFPAYKYDEKLDRLIPANRGPALAYLTFLAIFAWGCAATMASSPVYVGLGFCSLSMVFALIFTVHYSRLPDLKFSDALDILLRANSADTIASAAKYAKLKSTAAIESVSEELAEPQPIAAAHSIVSTSAVTAGAAALENVDATAPVKEAEHACSVVTAKLVQTFDRIQEGRAVRVAYDATLGKILGPAIPVVENLNVDAMAAASADVAHIETKTEDLEMQSTSADAAGAADPAAPAPTPAAESSAVGDVAMADWEQVFPLLPKKFAALDDAVGDLVQHQVFFRHLVTRMAASQRLKDETDFRDCMLWLEKEWQAGSEVGNLLEQEGLRELALCHDRLSLAVVDTWSPSRKAKVLLFMARHAEYKKELEEANRRRREQDELAARERERVRRENAERLERERQAALAEEEERQRREREEADRIRAQAEAAQRAEEEREERERLARERAAEERARAVEQERMDRESRERAAKEAAERDETRRKIEEAERMVREADARRIAAEAEARRLREAEERRLMEEREAQRQREAEAQRLRQLREDMERREAELRRQREDELAREHAAEEQAARERARQQEEAELARRRAEAEAAERRMAEERAAAEQAAQKRAQEEQARIEAERAREDRARREADAARQQAELARAQEERNRKAAAEAEMARKKKAEEAAQRQAEAEDRRRKKQEEMARLREQRAREQERERLEAERKAQEELEAAKHADPGDPEASKTIALRAVRDIEQRCAAAGRPYEDEFVGPRALAKNPTVSTLVRMVPAWKRAREMFAQPMVVGTDDASFASFADIRQGQLGDCWLLSAMTVLIAKPDLLKTNLITTSVSEHGVYAVQFFIDGRWQSVIVDDRFPSDGYHPMFVNNSSQRIWPMLLEKAYAKINRTYEDIVGGVVHVGLAELTGGVPELVDFMADDVRQAAEAGSLWAKLLQFHRAGHLLGCGSPEGSDTTISSYGIAQGHAYAILRLEEYSDQIGGNFQLVQLRNPWGHTEWTGDWSDGDTVHWTRRAISKLGFTEGDDGVFWMSFQDLLKHFSAVYVCRVFQDVARGGQWYVYRASSEWRGETAAGVTAKGRLQYNPQFAIPVAKPTRLFITLEQDIPRGEEFHVAFFVLNQKGKRAGKLLQRCMVGSSGSFVNSKQVSCELTLEPAAAPYTLLCTTYDGGKECPFNLQIFADQPLKITGNEIPFLDPAKVPVDA